MGTIQPSCRSCHGLTESSARSCPSGAAAAMALAPDQIAAVHAEARNAHSPGVVRRRGRVRIVVNTMVMAIG